MYGNITDYLAEALLEHEVGKTALTPPTNVYVGLSTTIPANDGTNITEPGAGYAQAELDGADFAAAASRAMANATDIVFGPAAADWGEIVAWFLGDDNLTFSAFQNILRWGRLGKVYTTLAEELTEIDTTISLADASSLPAAGTVMIDGELITYTGKSVNDLTGCTRGTGGTAAHAHASGVDVFSCLPRTVLNGDTLKFAAGDLVMSYKA